MIIPSWNSILVAGTDNRRTSTRRSETIHSIIDYRLADILASMNTYLHLHQSERFGSF